MPRRDRGVDVVAVEGAVAGERGHRPVDPVEQGTDPRAVVGVLVGERRCDDVAGVGVRGEVEFLPGATSLGAVLLRQPLAGAAEPQPRAVHQQVHRPAPGARGRHLQRLRPAAERRMVGHGEIEAEQLEDGADQAFGLAQRQAEHRPQRQG
ncbi:MAG: hypothetical protein AVDCRST_MAG04-716, partial [uncultured Acetobacteraceae bacterium]